MGQAIAILAPKTFKRMLFLVLIFFFLSWLIGVALSGMLFTDFNSVWLVKKLEFWKGCKTFSWVCSCLK